MVTSQDIAWISVAKFVDCNDPSIVRWIVADKKQTIYALEYTLGHNVKICSQFKLGESIHILRDGPNLKPNVAWTLLGMSPSGSMYLLLSLEESIYQLLKSLQKKIEERLSNTLYIGSMNWSQYRNSGKSTESNEFVDGDLLFLFLDMDVHTQNNIASSMQTSLELLRRQITQFRGLSI